MSSDEAAQLRVAIDRLRFAETDMKAAAAGTAELLRVREEKVAYLSFLLLAGVYVTYARPWTKNKIGRLDDEYLPPDGTPQREVHDYILQKRDQFAAHTDPAGARETVDPLGMGTYVESLRPYMNDHGVARISELCLHQAQRFTIAADELEARRKRL